MAAPADDARPPGGPQAEAGAGDQAEPQAGPPPRGELPTALDGFVGRKRELTRLRSLLRSSRLLTLVGPGGVGKTRLARELVGGRVGGRGAPARLVELDSLQDGGRLVPFTAVALGVAERGGHPILESLVRTLSNSGVLLVLDNCEHLIEPCARLSAELLQRCPGLRIVATSREPLRVPGEVVFRVGELTLPPPGSGGDLASLRHSDAVGLFVDRARACEPDFALTPSNARTVAEICRRLDGLPLAIELAARRAGSLPLPHILAGLDDQLTLLADGFRTGPVRHRELGAAVEWSHTLLDPDEQAVFRRLSILAGGFSPEGARAVCAADDEEDAEGVEPDDVLRLLCALEEKSLVVRAPGSPDTARFRQLSPIRAYALGLLRSAGELDAARDRAVAWLAALVGPGTPLAPAGDELAERLEIEEANLASAVQWTADEGGDRHLRLAVGLARLRRHQEQVTEARTVLAGALAAGAAAVRDRECLSGALALAARTACMQGDHEDGMLLAEEAVAVERADGHRPAGLADALDALAVARLSRRDFVAAEAVYRECLDLVRPLGNPLTTAVHQHRLAWALLHTDALAEARRLMAECLPVLRELAPPNHQAAALHTTGALQLALGDLDTAEEAFVEVLHRAPADSFHALYPVEGLAIVAAGRSESRRAVRLAASAAAAREQLGMRPEAEWERRVAGAVNRARARIDREGQNRAATEETSLRGERLVAYALRAPDTAPGLAQPGGDSPLTAREHQIALLVSKGLTNRQIAERLRRSTGTIATHLNSIRDKLGVRSRTQIALWAVGRRDRGVG
ncbi:ATP-binding protein [Streptomyces sp. KR80]|uniref:ATP-binding protein n=1 Tax=Streptomyces sp. KR80 TaxID=3457426 RepID=UPI003FD019F3